MAAQPEPEITLYDLACTQNTCFSPTVWRIRLMLNYKEIPYKTVFLEFPDIEPTLKELGLVPSETSTGVRNKYTVPAIHHVPTNTYIMDSLPIAQFLESTYPERPIPLTSEHGRQIESEARLVVGKVFQTTITPREIHILSPRSQEYFRRTREATIGRRLEDLLLEPEKEDQLWKGMDDKMRAVSELIMENKDKGPFVLGDQISYTDFFIAGSLQSIRVVDESLFQRIFAYEGFKAVYEACLAHMEKKD
ncbi:Thioredoxin-like protein [Glarea lozoyensis ATCC 20868]|uniref:Thioredoxin-like protein n=2 Tax=Glarea lozoyensis TaxID=101852 RepID=S3EEX7_GLAL2|nr:Thioredoxin-like protein [Glarea lozoyensis ATCC 20868]EHK99259.1 hypothetical protein M7I_4946 [Glarea lozoyensis 74030]EPE36748.1 Thioredoxin-like protein [Glarea lozoyensis ATCC 20868]